MAKQSIIDFLFEKKKRRKKRPSGYSMGDIGIRVMRDDPSTYPAPLKRRKKKKDPLIDRFLSSRPIDRLQSY